jgi:mono/diheme cytochrome c family protein
MQQIVGMAALVFALTACAAQIEQSSVAALADDGRDIAERQCAACHAIGAHGESSNPVAPPFRILFSRYHAEVLEEELIAGIKIAHPMPEFQFNSQGTEALIVYLRSIQQAPEADVGR